MRVRLAPVSRPRNVGGLDLRPGVWTPVPEALRVAVATAAALLGPLLVVDVPAPAPERPAPPEAIPAPPLPSRRRAPRPVPLLESSEE